MRKIAAILLVLITVGCSQPKVDQKAEGDRVMQLSREWSQAASTGDVEKIVNYWEDDAIVMSTGQASYKGKQAIRKMVEDSYNIPGFSISWQPQSVEVAESGDMAYLIENAQVSFTDSTGKAITQYNKGVTIWRKQGDGSWKNVVDFSTPDPSQNK